jgi:hypothetical protein
MSFKYTEKEVIICQRSRTTMRMRRYASNFVGYVQRTQVSKESCYSAPEVKVIHPNKRQVVIVVFAMSGINMN